MNNKKWKPIDADDIKIGDEVRLVSRDYEVRGVVTYVSRLAIDFSMGLTRTKSCGGWYIKTPKKPLRLHEGLTAREWAECRGVSIPGGDLEPKKVAQLVAMEADFDELPVGSMVAGLWLGAVTWTKHSNKHWKSIGRDYKSSAELATRGTSTHAVIRRGWSKKV